MIQDSPMIEIKEIEEKVILIGVDLDNYQEDVEESLEELEELAKTAGALTIKKVIQKLERFHPAHYVGKGKVEEIKEMVQKLGASGVICDDELSPVQLKNLEDMLDTKVMDRTMLILDIFAQRATSKEGKIQVELAQLQYRLTRLTGLGKSLSRLGGGIGTRGPGEKKLETDRRHIRNRISELKSSLREVENHRNLIRDRRSKMGTPLIGIVGYTNAGKSTLLNLLTEADVLAEDKLFATLDPTTRKVKLPGGTEVLLTDTVGFIRKLPHHLVEAFRSTLEETQYAHILLHVVDASSIAREQHMKTVYETLKSLKALDHPVITVYNKMDMEIPMPLPTDSFSEKIIQISAIQNTGIDDLLNSIEEVLQKDRKKVKLLIPYEDGKNLDFIHKHCEVLQMDHIATGIYIEAYVDKDQYYKIEDYMVEESLH